MDENERVGGRIADLRQQRALRQEDFLELLATQGVSWTRTVLSRVESGSRALKWTEGMAIAQVLGVDPSALGSESAPTEIDMQIQTMRIKRSDALRRQQQATADLKRINSGLSSMLLLAGLRSNATDVEYNVHGSSAQFIYLLAAWFTDPVDGGWAYGENGYSTWTVTGDGRRKALEALGISLEEEFDDSVDFDSAEESDAAENAHYREVLRQHFPNVTFTEAEPPGGTFAVDGIDVW